MSEKLTVILWLWDGWRPIYDYRHVNTMARMIGENLSMPHRVVCITDKPEGIDCDTFPLWDIDFHVEGLPIKFRPGAVRPNSYRRLKMFSAWAVEQFPGKILSIDLDAVVLGKLDPLLSDHDFRINHGRAAPYNGGMWMLRTGTRQKVWDTFGPQAWKITNRKKFVGSDQAWIAHVLPREMTWGRGDGVYHYSLTERFDPLEGARVMFTAGAQKPWHQQFAKKFPQAAAEYARHAKAC